MKESFLTTEIFFKDAFSPILLFPGDDKKLFAVAKGLYVISSKFTSEDVKSIFCNAFTGWGT